MPHPDDQSFIIEEVIEFLEDYDVFRNLNAVEISYNPNRTIMIAFTWTDSVVDPDFDVETFIYAMPLEEFIQTFNVRVIDDLKFIQPGSLDHLYEIGRADVGCIIVQEEDCYCMQYRKTNNILMATDDEDVHHVVSADLKSFQDFKRYTFRHYGLADC